MKVLDRYILNSYLTKFLSFFVIIMVVFIFQTIWMFIDDLAGKELDAEILFKFIIFYCPKLIPLVLPLTVLLASIMTFGDLAENYEFAAIKSSGISLFRSMKSLLIFNTVLCFCVFFISNNLIPFSEFKLVETFDENEQKIKTSFSSGVVDKESPILMEPGLTFLVILNFLLITLSSYLMEKLYHQK